MAIRSDSYSSVAEVEAFTRHLHDGAGGFTSSTRPKLTEVETIIDRVSGALNTAIWRGGFNPSTISANSTAKLACDEYVTAQAVARVELVGPGRTMMGDENQSRAVTFVELYKMPPTEFVEEQTHGWRRMGLGVADPTSQGLAFTGINEHDERADPDSDTLEQPKFRRGQFDA